VGYGARPPAPLIYPTTLDPAHIQRVADVMKQFGLLKASFNASTMTH
jgi:hypothetical protein